MTWRKRQICFEHFKTFRLGEYLIISHSREEQDLLDKVILIALKKYIIYRTALEKKVLTTSYTLAILIRYDNSLRNLLTKEYIEHVNRDGYSVTQKGEKYMDIT